LTEQLELPAVGGDVELCVCKRVGGRGDHRAQRPIEALRDGAAGVPRQGPRLLPASAQAADLLEQPRLVFESVPFGRQCLQLVAPDEGLFLLEVPGPDFLALLQVFLAAREEGITRLAEALPDGLLLAPRRRPDRFPLRL